MPTESLPSREPSPIERSAFEPRAGLKLGRYELVAQIGSGGMAQVWLAQQRGEFGFKRPIAIKVIRPEHAGNVEFRRMFLDEARLASRVHHRNVVEVLDLGEDGAIVFQAMTLVEGDSLANLVGRARTLPEGRLAPSVVARIIADVAAGLHAAHQLVDDEGNALHLVHRDVSPQNVLVATDGIARIADFGIAKALGRLADETEAGQLKGKMAYLSPEQAERRPIDRRSDIFATGIVMWEALTGVRLFRGDDVVETIDRIRTLQIPDPREHVPSLPTPLAEIVMHALARRPDDRFQTSAALSEALEPWKASEREVGAIVESISKAEIEQIRSALRGPTTNRAAPIAEGTFAAATTEVTPRPRSRAPLAIAAVVIVAGTTGLGIYLRKPAPVVSVAPVASAEPAPTDSAASTEGTEPATSASVTTTPSAAKPKRTFVRKPVTTTAPSASAPKLPFSAPK